MSVTNSSTSALPSDPLLTYFGLPPISQDAVQRMGAVLKYWVREEGHGSPLARVALDVLTAPGMLLAHFICYSVTSRSKASSVDAERAFSGGRMAVNYRRHRMSLTTFRAKMALGSWYGTPLL